LKQTHVWALVFPDGRIQAGFLYETRKSLKAFAPADIYGDTSTWERARKEGYRSKKFYLSETPDAAIPAKGFSSRKFLKKARKVKGVAQ
jgi:hypothetical protein